MQIAASKRTITVEYATPLDEEFLDLGAATVWLGARGSKRIKLGNAPFSGSLSWTDKFLGIGGTPRA